MSTARSDHLQNVGGSASWSRSVNRAEPVDLIETQLNTLEKETYGIVTEVELGEYQDRCERIMQLYVELVNREAAA